MLEREVADLHQRNEELTSLAHEAQALKDEMDILRWAEPLVVLYQNQSVVSWNGDQRNLTCALAQQCST